MMISLTAKMSLRNEKKKQPNANDIGLPSPVGVQWNRGFSAEESH
jgi:hypothetical protein